MMFRNIPPTLTLPRKGGGDKKGESAFFVFSLPLDGGGWGGGDSGLDHFGR